MLFSPRYVRSPTPYVFLDALPFQLAVVFFKTIFGRGTLKS